MLFAPPPHYILTFFLPFPSPSESPVTTLPVSSLSFLRMTSLPCTSQHTCLTTTSAQSAVAAAMKHISDQTHSYPCSIPYNARACVCKNILRNCLRQYSDILDQPTGRWLNDIKKVSFNNNYMCIYFEYIPCTNRLGMPLSEPVLKVTHN